MKRKCDENLDDFKKRDFIKIVWISLYKTTREQKHCYPELVSGSNTKAQMVLAYKRISKVFFSFRFF